MPTAWLASWPWARNRACRVRVSRPPPFYPPTHRSTARTSGPRRSSRRQSWRMTSSRTSPPARWWQHIFKNYLYSYYFVKRSLFHLRGRFPSLPCYVLHVLHNDPAVGLWEMPDLNPGGCWHYIISSDYSYLPPFYILFFTPFLVFSQIF